MTDEDKKLIDRIMAPAKCQWTGVWSYKKNGILISENYTYRTDTQEDLEEHRDFALRNLPSATGFPDDEGDIAQKKTVDEIPMCPVHKKDMKFGKYGYFCATKVGNGWCKWRSKDGTVYEAGERF